MVTRLLTTFRLLEVISDQVADDVQAADIQTAEGVQATGDDQVTCDVHASDGVEATDGAVDVVQVADDVKAVYVVSSEMSEFIKTTQTMSEPGRRCLWCQRSAVSILLNSVFLNSSQQSSEKNKTFKNIIG